MLFRGSGWSPDANSVVVATSPERNREGVSMSDWRQRRVGKFQVHLFWIGIAASLACNATGCSYHQIARCTEPVQKELSSERLSLASTPQDLRLYCSHMATAHSCIEHEISKCSREIQENYRNAMRAEKTVMEEVCSPGETQDDYLQHAPCFKAMLLEGGACHDPYARLKAVTAAMDPTSEHRQQHDDGTEPAYNSNDNNRNSVARQRPSRAGQRHYLIDNQLIADMCCEYHALHACYMAKTEAVCGAKALEVSLRSLNKLNGGMQYSCAKVKRRCAGYVVSSSATASGGQSILGTVYNLLRQFPTML